MAQVAGKENDRNLKNLQDQSATSILKEEFRSNYQRTN